MTPQRNSSLLQIYQQPQYKKIAPSSSTEKLQQQQMTQRLGKRDCSSSNSEVRSSNDTHNNSTQKLCTSALHNRSAQQNNDQQRNRLHTSLTARPIRCTFTHSSISRYISPADLHRTDLHTRTSNGAIQAAAQPTSPSSSSSNRNHSLLSSSSGYTIAANSAARRKHTRHLNETARHCKYTNKHSTHRYPEQLQQQQMTQRLG